MLGWHGPTWGSWQSNQDIAIQGAAPVWIAQRLTILSGDRDERQVLNDFPTWLGHLISERHHLSSPCAIREATNYTVRRDSSFLLLFIVSEAFLPLKLYNKSKTQWVWSSFRHSWCTIGDRGWSLTILVKLGGVSLMLSSFLIILTAYLHTLSFEYSIYPQLWIR